MFTVIYSAAEAYDIIFRKLVEFSVIYIDNRCGATSDIASAIFIVLSLCFDLTIIRIFIFYLLKIQKSVANKGILSVTSDGTIIFDIISAVEEKSIFNRIATTQIISITITATTIAAVR